MFGKIKGAYLDTKKGKQSFLYAISRPNQIRILVCMKIS